MKVVHVAAAIIFSPDRQKILIARRPDHVHQGGLWEFPGGKVEDGEFSLGALSRELDEELAIKLIAAEPFTDIHYCYPDKTVFLNFWQTSQFSGTPKGNEGQTIAWVAVSDLKNYEFPAANQPIVDRLLLGAY